MEMETNFEFQKRRQLGNDKINEQDFLPFKRFMALDSRAYADGSIPLKYKELMGLVGSAVLRCNDCIHYHIEKCIENDCTKDEINEALNIALIIGGSIVIPHLRFALMAVDGVLNEKFNKNIQDEHNFQEELK